MPLVERGLDRISNANICLTNWRRTIKPLLQIELLCGVHTSIFLLTFCVICGVSTDLPAQTKSGAPGAGVRLVVQEGPIQTPSLLRFVGNGAQFLDVDFFSGIFQIFSTENGRLIASRQLGRHPSNEHCSAFGPDNADIYIADNQRGLISRISVLTGVVTDFAEGVGNVEALQVFPDGSKVALVTEHSDLVIVNSTTGSIVSSTPVSGIKSVLGLSFSPSGKYLLVESLSLSGAQHLNIIDQQGHVQRNLALKKWNSVHFASDERYVIIDPDRKEAEGPIRLFRWDDSHEQDLLIEAALTVVAYSSDGRWVLAADGSRSTEWIAVDPEPLSLRRFPINVAAKEATFLGTSDHALVVSDSVTQLWNFRASRIDQTWQFPTTVAVLGPDGEQLLVVGQDHQLSCWNLRTKAARWTIREPLDPVNKILFSDRAAELVATIKIGSIGMSPTFAGRGYTWSLRKGSETDRFRFLGNQADYSHGGRYLISAFGADVQRYERDGTQESSALPDWWLAKLANQSDVVPAAGLARYRNLVEDRKVTITSRIVNQAISPQADRAICLDADGTVWVLNLADKTVVHRIHIAVPDGKEPFDLPSNAAEFYSSIQAIRISPNGDEAALGTRSGFIVLLNLKDGIEVWRRYGPLSTVRDLVFSPSTVKLLAAVGGTRAAVFDRESGFLIQQWEAHPKRSDIAPSERFLDTIQPGALIRDLVNSENATTVATSSDGSILVSGDAQGLVNIHSWIGNARRQNFRVPAAIDGIAVANESHTVWISSGGGVSVFDLNSFSELLRLYSFQNGAWAVVAPDGRFDTNDVDGGAEVHWIVGDDPLHPLGIETFIRDYYTPGLLPKVLARNVLKPIYPLASLNRSQPDVRILRVDRERGGKSVSLKVLVVSRPSDVQRDNGGRPLESGGFDLHVFRDGQIVRGYPVYVGMSTLQIARDPRNTGRNSWRDQHYILDTGQKVITLRDIPLPQRKGVDQVTFTAYAFNSDRVKSETSPRLVYKFSPPAQPRQRRAYLITMGVNATEASGPWDLTVAAPSAREAARLWRERLSKEYEVVEINLLSEVDADGAIARAAATKANLHAILDVLAGREQQVSAVVRRAIDPQQKLRPATPDDAVVLHVASHGYADPEGRFFLVPFDTGTQRGIDEQVLTRCQSKPDGSPLCEAAESFLSHAISSDDLAAWWSGVDGGEMMMVLDSCHSGAAPGQGFRPGPLGDRGFGQLAYDKGLRIFAATQPDKVARGTAVQGPATLLIEALNTAATPTAGQGISAWLRTAERMLPQRARQLYPTLNENDLQWPELMDFRRESNPVAVSVGVR